MTATESKTQHAYAAIRGRIVGGAYAPGQRLILRSLADELGMSTVPVREGLRRLEAEGWVVFRPNIGAEVRPIDASQWVAVMDALALTEGRATAEASHFMTAADIARGRAINEDMKAAIVRLDPAAASTANQALHAVFHDRCPNPYLVDLVKTAADRISAMLRTVFVFVPTRVSAAVDEHEHLLQLVERGAPEAEIETFAREHKLHTIAAYLERELGARPSMSVGESISSALADGLGALPANR